MGSWMPITPEKPIPTRPNPVLPDRYGRPVPRENRQELAGIPVGHIQDMPNYNRAVHNLNPVGQAGRNEGYYGETDFSLHERSRKINQIAASYAQALSNGSSGRNNLIDLLAIKNAAAIASANRSNGRSTSLGNRPLIPNLNSQVENWTASNSSNLLIHNHAHSSSSSLLSNSSIFQLISPDGFPIAYQSNYKLNSAPRTEASAGLCVTSTPPFSTVTQELLKFQNKQLSRGDFSRTEAGVASRVTTTLPLVTPDQFKKLQANRLSTNENTSMDVSSSQEKDKQENLLSIFRNETIQCNYDEHLQNVAPSAVISISTPKEKKDSDNASDQGIDLNKTPQQKQPKRRKHRPKVIVEGKRKRTPKTATPKSTKTKENPGGKRKYVRRKGLKESATQPADILRDTTDPRAGAVASSCRRALNFDLEKIRDENQGEGISQQEEMQQSYWRTFNSNLDSQTKALDSVTDSRYRTKSSTMIGQQNGLPVENQQPGTVSNHTYHQPEAVSNQTHQQPGIVCNQTLSMSEILADYISMPERQACAASLSPRKDFHMENLNVIRANTMFENLERTRQPIPPSTPQSAPKTSSSFQVARGSKREYSHSVEQKHPRVINSMGSSLLYQDIFQMDGLHRNSNNIDSGSAETHKKKKIENGLYTIVNGKPSSVHVIKECSVQVQTKSASDINGNGSPLQRNNGTVNFHSGRYKIAKMGNSAVNELNSDWHAQSMASGYNLPKERIFSAQHLHTEKMRETNRLTSVLDFASSTASENYNLLPLTPPGRAPAPADRLAPKTYCTNVSAKKNVKQTLAKSASSRMDQMLPEQRKDLHDPHQYSAERRGPLVEQIHPIPMDEIIHRFNSLNLNGSTNPVQEQEQNAIVPYKQDGTIVPYEGFELIKKRKPRPKVDLDAETNRIWNLLMGKEANEGLEEMDKEKEKWWEEERRVFQGRADSFIARMHLVQGDRRFSRWKGSVVDSVIGVFLTQNVSDHLSSSAFMSLAARFPLKSNNRTCDMDGMNILVEEPEVCMLNPDDAIQWNEQVPRHPLSSQSSMTPHEPTEPQRENETSGIERTSLLEANSHSLEEEVISPQDSFSSSILQGTGIKSYSGSNSETEDPTSGSQANQDNGSTNFLQEGDATLFQDIYNCLNDTSQFQEQYGHGHIQLNDIENSQHESRLDSIEHFGSSLTFTQLLNINSPQNQLPLIRSGNWQPHMTSFSELLEGSEIYSGECISSQPSTACGFPKAKDVGYTSQSNRQLAEDVSETTVQQNGIPMPEEMSTMSPPAPLRKDSMQQQTVSQLGSHSKHNQPSCESRSPELVNLAETPAKVQHVPNCPELTEKTCINGRITVVNNLSENQVIEPNSREQVISNHRSYGEANPKISKSKKGKADGEKKNAIDWDRLRKQVHSNGQKKERSQDTMDSLDYEAIRCADVKEISNAIKERGMNNMLAERIKEFLNRLVQEHDSIDLEWLRDVPPDKAKDYLLSIRGLGLKSVECVRLLTLHHLAFPVDTNVGRIAVRLGWVPLQPLPESLQLHLLELYPMLESIQKYLWPRLCKLDQRTLYELHYQLITFGKVFCTKSKPNCNACPMRGECRHFASAFASARLALPGPEEKNIVTSTAPPMAERKPTVVINPVPLPPPEENSIRVAEIGNGTGNCEPIIEVPATPEQECTEISESDIEDKFYEDPDEIPTIKLNIEEFTVTLQNYMQENMELQEVDMSKALVALNPEAASIPAPKLKNVSRLRTEHQVYQLPDSHPLLKGMDRREPDDPSPYLLAIWTPGETANSIQPPEKSCGSQESGKLCNEKTCFSCNSVREANSQTVRGTLLIPCRTAMRGSFPLNGTYFQVNEVFADHESSLNPIDVPREWIWNLPRRVVYFGTSVSTIFKGLSTEGIQFCFWKGFVCVRGFDQKSRAPRPLMARLHFPASKLAKTKNENK